MQRRLVRTPLWLVVLATGCLDFGTGTGPAGARTCEQLGWSCGNDATGASCGTCDFGRSCSSGACVDPGERVIASNATAYALAGGYSGVFFSLPAAGTVRFTATSSGIFQLGVFTTSDWAVFASGQQANAYVLTNPTPSVTERVSLPAGTFTLGFRCMNAVEACTIRYNIIATN
ncbi:MAG: hypothetical protein JWM10_438 [Myxococcaceae bacterium]|nr:hypothetical protein [Myxococcaceae bacterium]